MTMRMNEDQKRTLLGIARDAVRAAITGGPPPAFHSDDPDLNASCGCFVTLKTGDRLRGCIGQFLSDRPLIEMVAAMAKAAATEDPRFFNDRLRPEELSRLDIEISVLSPLVRTYDPSSLRPGIDGVYIKRGHATGCFLPQVATETGWDAETFLSFCCSHKAGLPPDAWKDPATEVYLFTADVFGAPSSQI